MTGLFGGTTPEMPPWVRPDAAGCWREVMSRIAPEGGHAAAVGRYANMTARLIELEAFLMGAGPSGTTLAHRDKSGAIVRVVELPQAGEYRRLQVLLLAYERELGLLPRR